MVTSTKKVTSQRVGSGGKTPGPNGKKPGGNGFRGGNGSGPKFSPEAYRITIWVVLAAVIMMFAAFSSVYIMSSTEERQPVSMPRMFLLSTFVILVSSGAFHKAKRSLQQEQPRAYRSWLLITLILGIGFLLSQFSGWRELARAGVYFSGHPRSSFFYLATALHGAHLMGGIALVLYLVLGPARRVLPVNTEKNVTWTGVVGLYWHTMGGIWVWLFVLLLIFK